MIAPTRWTSTYIDEFRDRDTFVSPADQPMYNFADSYDQSHYERPLAAVVVPNPNAASSSSSSQQQQQQQQYSSQQQQQQRSSGPVLNANIGQYELKGLGDARDGSLSQSNYSTGNGPSNAGQSGGGCACCGGSGADQAQQAAGAGYSWGGPTRNQYHIPGYRGFIKGAQFCHGATYGKMSRKCLSTDVSGEQSSFMF
jgi:hypothetical protein